MRVLIHSTALKSDAAGVQGVVQGLGDHLRTRGHRVITAWPDGDGTATDWRLRLRVDAGPSGRPSAGELGRAGIDAAALAARLARFRPDVVNLHYPRGQTLYFQALRRFFGYRLIISFHGSDYHEASPALKARLPDWMAQADAVTAVSGDLGKRLSELAPETRPIVIPNGINLNFWSAGEEARDPRLLVAAGRLIPLKRFDLLIEAFAEGAPKDARLILAGEGPERPALAALIDRLDLGSRIELAGRLDQRAIRTLFHRAGLFALTSSREGMPLVLLEAMAAGLPAVATAVGGVPDVLGTDCGALVQADDRAALVREIATRLGDAERLRREGAAAHARIATHFDAAANFTTYETLMSEAGK